MHHITGNTYSKEKKFYDSFSVFEFCNLEEVLLKQNCDVLYVLKDGLKDNLISEKVRTVIHCVFTCDQKNSHGNVYACISNTINLCNAPIVPHICLPMPKVNSSTVEDKIVIGRYGGMESFDVEFVPSAIKRSLEANSKLYFQFMNTPQFLDHPRVKYLEKTIDLKEKS
jgi:hypothetical protein